MGLVAEFWHISWVAGVVFLVSAIVALIVHTAGHGRLERDRHPSRKKN